MRLLAGLAALLLAGLAFWMLGAPQAAPFEGGRTPRQPPPDGNPQASLEGSEPVETQRRDEAPLELAAPKIPGTLVLVRAEPDGALRDLLAELDFLPQAQVQVHSSTGALYAPVPEDGYPPDVFARLPEDPQATRLAVTIEGVEVTHFLYDGEADPVVLRVSARELERQFSGFEVRFRGQTPEAPAGAVEFRLQRSGMVSVPVDDEGRLRVFGLSPGWNRLTGTFPGYAKWIEDPMFGAPTRRDLGTVRLEDAHVVTGRIVNEEPEVSRLVELVRLQWNGTAWDKRRVWRTESEQGAFAFRDVPPGTWALRVVARKGGAKAIRPLESASPWTRSGLYEGFGFDDDNPEPRQFFTHWDRYRLEDLRESDDLIVDTRGGSIEGVELQVLPRTPWTTRVTGSAEQGLVVHLRSAAGVPVASPPCLGGEVVHWITWPGRFSAQVERPDGSLGPEQEFEVTREGQGVALDG